MWEFSRIENVVRSRGCVGCIGWLKQIIETCKHTEKQNKWPNGTMKLKVTKLWFLNVLGTSIEESKFRHDCKRGYIWYPNANIRGDTGETRGRRRWEYVGPLQWKCHISRPWLVSNGVVGGCTQVEVRNVGIQSLLKLWWGPECVWVVLDD